MVTLAAVIPLLLTPARPLEQQPFPDAAEYADAARQLAQGHGYVTYVHAGTPQPPRYPPGFSLALAPFASVGPYPANVQLGARFFAALYVVTTALCAAALGGARAALIAAVLVGLSPFARVSASLVLADALAAAGAVLLLLCLRDPERPRSGLAGALAGALLLVRIPLGVTILALCLALPPRERARAAAFAFPGVLALALYHWQSFGSPLRTGYEYWGLTSTIGLPTFRLPTFHWRYAIAAPPIGDGPWIVPDLLGGALLAWVCPCPPGGAQSALPNLAFYLAVLLGLFWVFAPPLAPLPGLWALWRRRREPAAAFVLWTLLLSLALFVPYFYQGARFMAPAATLLVVASAGALGGRWPPARAAAPRRCGAGAMPVTAPGDVPPPSVPLRVTPGDPHYRRLAKAEAAYWSRQPVVEDLDAMHPATTRRFLNEAFTGDPVRSWFDDLVARGPYRAAAMLGCSEGAFERRWLAARASEQLDVYELSRRVIRQARGRLSTRRLGLPWPDRRARFCQSDLNFVRLPREVYDVVWSTGCLHHVVNLEHLFAEVEQALRPGGLFAFEDYVGEPGLQYRPERLALVNVVLREIPLRFRRGGVEAITPPRREELSPFEAIRTDTVAVARERFEVVHLAFAGILFPLAIFLDLHAMEREAPALLERVLEVEREARRAASPVPPAAVYAVFRRRAG